MVVKKRINQVRNQQTQGIYNITVSFAEFYDDDNGFGIVRKGKQHLSSDFLFDSLLKWSSGYMITLMPVQDDLQYKRLVIKAS